jgi:hypothetical protein
MLWRYRLATARNRSLPHFIIIGAQKSGTTSLYHYVNQHPSLIRSFLREVHYFDGGLDPAVDTYRNGPDWYRAHFPLTRSAHGQFKTCEASPLYMLNPLVPGRIAELIPQVRLIAILRNPTERAISHYFHERRYGREPLSIEQALRAEESRLEPILHAGDFKNPAFIYHAYKTRGVYRPQLERFLKHFPRQQLLVVKSEELFEAPQSVVRRVFEFVGVDADFVVADVDARNVASNKVQVGPGIREYLDDYFAPHNRMLYELTGEDYGW